MRNSVCSRESDSIVDGITYVKNYFQVTAKRDFEDVTQAGTPPRSSRKYLTRPPVAGGALPPIAEHSGYLGGCFHDFRGQILPEFGKGHSSRRYQNINGRHDFG